MCGNVCARVYMHVRVHEYMYVHTRVQNTCTSYAGVQIGVYEPVRGYVCRVYVCAQICACAACEYMCTHVCSRTPARGSMHLYACVHMDMHVNALCHLRGCVCMCVHAECTDVSMLYMVTPA